MLYIITGSFFGAFVAYNLITGYNSNKKIKKINGVSIEYLIGFIGLIVGGFYGRLYGKMLVYLQKN